MHLPIYMHKSIYMHLPINMLTPINMHLPIYMHTPINMHVPTHMPMPTYLHAYSTLSLSMLKSCVHMNAHTRTYAYIFPYRCLNTSVKCTRTCE